MADIGTTIAPWMIFFQQSAVVDKGMQEKDMVLGKIDTAFGSLLTVVVAAGCVILTATLIPGTTFSTKRCSTSKTAKWRWFTTSGS
jgi:Mn2+/Fe2+ NRAMP family transporter